jgi:GNAT superfamily N-acetyltransferase
MAISDLVLARKPMLTPAELADAEALVREANWNQLAADWRIFLAHGQVYAAQTASGRIVATTATLPFGGRFAWVSMVLVTAEYRRRGIATELMRLAIGELAERRLVPALDATPDGRAVYRRMGFEDSWGFQRLLRKERRAAAGVADPSINVRPIAEADWSAICAYDAAAFGAARHAVLEGLRRRLPLAELVAEHAGRIAGVLLGRDGRIAGHLGPLIAEDDKVACALLERATEAIDGPLFIDFADAKSLVAEFLTAHGFAAVRPFTRMIKDTSTRFDDAQRTFAVVGPEFG